MKHKWNKKKKTQTGGMSESKTSFGLVHKGLLRRPIRRHLGGISDNTFNDRSHCLMYKAKCRCSSLHHHSQLYYYKVTFFTFYFLLCAVTKLLFYFFKFFFYKYAIT